MDLMSSLLVGAVGVLNVGMGVKVIKDPVFLEDYVKRSPKAWLLRKLLGVERTMMLTKTVFAPLAIVLGCALLVLVFVSSLNM